MEFLGRDGNRLFYQETGEGRPLVLIHGYMGRSGHWVDSGIAGRLAERGYRVIMPDLHGHGTAPSRTTRLPTRRMCSATTGLR